MKNREEVLKYGLSFPDTYRDAPFHDDNWQLIRVKGSNKTFMLVYEKNESVWVVLCQVFGHLFDC